MLLKECNMQDAVELVREKGHLVIKPISTDKRKGWDAAFKKMHERRDDVLLIDDAIDLDMDFWQWK